MKRILFILLLTILFIGCGQNDSIKQTGSIKEYYENGQLKSEGNVVTGQQNGIWKYYYENGQLEFEGNYIDGKLNEW